ncbi:MAG TPA: thioesterase family protein [Candidatus Baltobacteraceae bacterium]|nr:thioesterase family protein [Candidatus Baltobacteraceae bacterium]
MLEGFPLVTRFTIPFSDIDMLQHVNNVAYIRWCEMVRTEYYARVMNTPITGERGIIQANINFTYERQLRYREAIAVGVRISRMGTKSFDFGYEIWSETYDARAAHGITTVVAYDFIGQHSIEIPAAWRDAIDDFERGPQQSFI